MSIEKTFVCLANSRKYTGRCVAGKEWDGNSFGPWVRPVTMKDKGVLNTERYCSDWRDPRLLDILEVRLLAPHPYCYQTENYLVDPSTRWRYVGRLSARQMLAGVDKVTGPLWINGESTECGRNDKISGRDADSLSTSLMLVQPQSLQMVVGTEAAGSSYARRRIRAHFSLAGHDYALSVTDPALEKQFKLKPDGFATEMSHPLLCLSLSEKFGSQNACYKLVAAVIPV